MMPVAAEDIELRLSGGLTNSDPDASLGGFMSEFAVEEGSLQNLFDNVAISESEAGLVDYRCIYVLNNHATDALALVAVFIQSNTPSADSTIEIGLDPAGIGNGISPGGAQQPSPAGEAPSGVTFLDYPSSGDGLAIGTLDAGEAQAVWLRRTVVAEASTPLSDAFTIRVAGIPI